MSVAKERFMTLEARATSARKRTCDRRPRLLNAVADGESAEEAQSAAVVLAAASAASERESLEARISALENARQNPNE